MKNKILSIVLALLLVISLAGNVVLYIQLVKAREDSNDYREAMSQLVILKADLDNANETITTLQNEITDMENATPTGAMEEKAEEITAEMLEGLSAELNEEQQEAVEADNTPENPDTPKTETPQQPQTQPKPQQPEQQQPQPQQPTTDLPELPDEFKMPPMTEPGNIHDGIGGCRAQ